MGSSAVEVEVVRGEGEGEGEGNWLIAGRPTTDPEVSTMSCRLPSISRRAAAADFNSPRKLSNLLQPSPRSVSLFCYGT